MIYNFHFHPFSAVVERINATLHLWLKVQQFSHGDSVYEQKNIDLSSLLLTCKIFFVSFSLFETIVESGIVGKSSESVAKSSLSMVFGGDR